MRLTEPKPGDGSMSGPMNRPRTRSGGRERRPCIGLALPGPVRDRFRAAGAVGLRGYMMGECRIIVAKEPPRMDWHLSISCPDRYPTWDEIADAREELLPGDQTFGMVLPPADQYVNVHDFVFHLHRLPVGFGS